MPRRREEKVGRGGGSSPGVLGTKLLLSGKQLDAVVEFEEGLLLWFVLHAFVLVKVLPSQPSAQNEAKKYISSHHIFATLCRRTQTI